MAKLYAFGLMCMAFLPIFLTCVLQDMTFKGICIFALAVILSVVTYWAYTIIPSNITDSVTIFFSESNHIVVTLMIIFVLSSYAAYRMFSNKRNTILNLEWHSSRSKLEFETWIKLYFSYKKWKVLVKNFNWCDAAVSNSKSTLCIISLPQIIVNSMPLYEAVQKVCSRARSIRHKVETNKKQYLVVLSEIELPEYLLNISENQNIIFLYYKNLNELTKMPPFQSDIIERPWLLNSTQKVIAESSEDLCVELANFFWTTKEHGQAVEWAKSAIAIKKSADNYIRLSDYYRNTKLFSESQELLTEALQVFPKDSRLVKRLAA